MDGVVLTPAPMWQWDWWWTCWDTLTASSLCVWFHCLTWHHSVYPAFIPSDQASSQWTPCTCAFDAAFNWGFKSLKKYIQKICKIIMGQYLLQCWRTDNIVCSLMLLVYLYTVHANSHVSVSVSVSPHCRPTWCGAALWAQSPGLEPWAEPVRH